MASKVFLPPSALKVGFVGFGEVNTPRDIIERKCLSARTAIVGEGYTIIDTEPVSDDPAGADVRRAIEALSDKGLDCLVVCIAGWIPTNTVIAVISEFRHLPMVLWGLAGYYEGERLITTADQAGSTAVRKTMADLGFTFRYVYDFPAKPHKVELVGEFLRSVLASRVVRHSKVGMMGFRDMNLYTTLYDGLSLKKLLGVEVEMFEMLDMVQRAEKADAAEVKAISDEVTSSWSFERPAAPETLEKSIRYYLGIRSIIEERRFDAVSLIDVDGMKKLLHLPPAMIFMLIANRLGLPTIPENDTLGSVTQLIVRALTGEAAAYFEFYEFMEDRLLIGVPDYVPADVIEGEMRVRPTAFGSFAEGVLNVSKVKTGPVTLCRLLQHEGAYALHVFTGKAVTPRSWEEAGWQQPAPQLPGLEIILDGSVDHFAQNVAGQHYILSYGDSTALLKQFCLLNHIQVIQG